MATRYLESVRLTSQVDTVLQSVLGAAGAVYCEQDLSLHIKDPATGTTRVIPLSRLDDLGGTPIVAKEVTFTEEGAGTYTGTISLPAGATLVDILVHATALWDAATSASLEIGDANDPDGYYTAVDLKATDLLANESLSFSLAGGVGGAYLPGTHALRRYSASARDIVATVVSSGAGTAGRTRVTVLYSLPGSEDSAAATFVAE